MPAAFQRAVSRLLQIKTKKVRAKTKLKKIRGLASGLENLDRFFGGSKISIFSISKFSIFIQFSMIFFDTKISKNFDP